MTKQLLILRHGKSDWDVDCNDYNRPLKKRGKRAVKKTAFYLLEQKLIPDYIISSPAKRATDTAKRICKALRLEEKQVNIDSRLYAAGLKDLLSVLADVPAEAIQVLLVGHNPGLEMILEYLYEGEIKIPESGKLLVTATLAVLCLPENWNSLSKGCAQTLSIIRPDD